MADVVSREKRSEMMSRIKSTDTSIEVYVRKWLFGHGFRYRKNDKRLPGKPDVVLPKYRTVIFVHGCFWHGHSGCSRSNLPKSNVEYWKEKINQNMVRDIVNTNKLKERGWRVIIVYECELENNPEVRLLNLMLEIMVH